MPEKRTVWLDTNVIIYYLRTNKMFSPTARALVSAAQQGHILLKIPSLVLSECVYVLMGKQFGLSKELVKQVLFSFLNISGVVAEEKTVIEEALRNFVKKGIDFTDAYLAAHAKAVKPAVVATVNIRDFHGLDVLTKTPGDLVLLCSTTTTAE